MHSNDSAASFLKICLWIFNGAAFESLFLSSWLNNSKHPPPVRICSSVCGCVAVPHMHVCLVCSAVVFCEACDSEAETLCCGLRQSLGNSSAPTLGYQRRPAEDIISRFASLWPVFHPIKLCGEFGDLWASEYFQQQLRWEWKHNEKRPNCPAAWKSYFLYSVYPRVWNLVMKRSAFE